MARRAGQDANKFGQMVDWAKQLPHQAPPPTAPAAAVPPEVSSLGFTGANMAHFFEHTWDFIDISVRTGKDTTFFPRGTTANDITTWLGEALRNLNPPGTSPRLPVPYAPEEVTIGIGKVQVGSKPASSAGDEIGQFFPLDGVTIKWPELEAIWEVLK